MKLKPPRAGLVRSALLLLPIAAIAAALSLPTGWLTAADHRDSAALTASPAEDIADVYVFQSPENAGNTVFALTVSGLIPPSEAMDTHFDPEVLYQWKIDTDGDAVENLVIQAYVTGDPGNQVMHFRGPAVPVQIGTFNRVLDGPDIASVAVSNGAAPIIAENQGVKVYAGVRDDPFFFDLAQFNQIIAGQASGFNDPGTDSLAGTNVLAIVIELPTSRLGGNSQLGVWGTTNRL